MANQNPNQATDERTKSIEEAAKENNMAVFNWDPGQLEDFARGSITLAQLEGISKDELEKMADVGYALLSQGKLDDSERIFAGLIALDPYNAYAHMGYGAVLQRLERYEESERAYVRALQIDGQATAVWANLGEVQILQGKLAEAVQSLTKAVVIGGNDRSDAAALRAQATLRALMQQLEATKG